MLFSEDADSATAEKLAKINENHLISNIRLEDSKRIGNYLLAIVNLN